MILRIKGTNSLKFILSALILPGAILAQAVVIEPQIEGEDSTLYREVSGAWTDADIVSAAPGVTAQRSRALESPEEAGPSVMEFRPPASMGEEILVSVTTPATANATGLTLELVGSDPPQIRPVMLTELSADKWFDVGTFTVAEGVEPVFHLTTTDDLQPVLADQDFEVAISAIRFQPAGVEPAPPQPAAPLIAADPSGNPFSGTDGQPADATVGVEDPFGMTGQSSPFSDEPGSASAAPLPVADPFEDTPADSSPFTSVPNANPTASSPFQDDAGQPVETSPPINQNPFGDVATATTDQPDPFGTSTGAPPAIAPVGDPFSGTAAPSTADPNPFGSSPAAPDPFGNSSTAASGNPFGNTSTDAQDPFATTSDVQIASTSPGSGNPFGTTTASPSASPGDPFGGTTSSQDSAASPFSDSPSDAGVGSPFSGDSPEAASPFSDSSSPSQGAPDPFGGTSGGVREEPAMAQNPFGGPSQPAPTTAASPFGGTPSAAPSNPPAAANPFGNTGAQPDMAASPFSGGPSDSMDDVALASPFGNQADAATQAPSSASSDNVPPSPFSDQGTGERERHLATQLIQSEATNFAATGRPARSENLFQQTENDQPVQEETMRATAIRWVRSPREAQTAALEQDRPVLVLFLGDDDNSKLFEQDVLSQPEISNTVNQFIAVRVPYVGDEPLVKKYSVRNAPYAVVLNKHGFTKGHVNLSQPDYRVLRDLQKHLK